MAKNRKKAQALWLTYIKRISQDDVNVARYKAKFEAMSDKEFDAYVEKVRRGEEFTVLISPNFAKQRPSTEENLKIAKELGHNFFPKIWIEGKRDVPTFLAPVPYLVVDGPVRRAAQSLQKKISVPDNMRVIDSMTGQPTGASQGAKISYPELQVCVAMGLEKSMLELMKYRGGDAKGYAAMRAFMSNYGQASLKNMEMFSSGVESKRLVNSFLTSAMLRSNL